MKDPRGLLWAALGFAVATYADLFLGVALRAPDPPARIAADIRELREVTRHGDEVTSEQSDREWLHSMQAIMSLNEYSMPPELVVFVRTQRERIDDAAYWRNEYAWCRWQHWQDLEDDRWDDWFLPERWVEIELLRRERDGVELPEEQEPDHGH
jgi:hypothetical protein